MRLIFFLAGFITFQTLHAQRFYENQMLYSDQMLEYLKTEADSLQKQWQTSILTSNLESQPYAITHEFALDTLVEQAYEDIQNGITWDAFTHKYTTVSIRKNILVTFQRGENYEKKKVLAIKSMLDWCRCPDIDTTTNIPSLKNKWLIDTYRPNAPTYPGLISGLFVTEVEAPKEISEPYASWIRYEDFITGPEPLFLNKYASMYAMYRKASPPRPAHDRFFEYIDIPGLPSPAEMYYTNAKYINFKDDYRFRNAKPYRIWQEKRELHIEENLDKKAEFKFLLEAAVVETIQLGIPDELLENWAFQYLSDDLSWAMMRLRPVYSNCGNDPAPTQRLYEIAQHCALFSENWYGFIQAHLGLINDRTDWSINYRTRFIRELETLGLDVPALLLGSVLQTREIAPGHYEGSVNRTGWALAQCKNAEQVAGELRNAIADRHLDDQNRIILYRVYKQMMYRKYALEFGMHEHKMILEQMQKEMIRVQSQLPAPWKISLDNLTEW